MAGPSLAERPPTVERELLEQSAPPAEVRQRARSVPAIFPTWRQALRYLSVWVGAGLLVYMLLLAGWLILRMF